MNSIIPLQIVRQINFQKSEHSFSGELRLDRLEQIGERKWACYWSCDYMCENGRIYGEDSLQALMNCLSFIADLFRDARGNGLSIWWKSPSDGSGFISGK